MISGRYRNVIAFHYGNLTHPSVDPPRIGFLSTVPNNASQLLADAVKTAQQNGKFECQFAISCIFLLSTDILSQLRVKLLLLQAQLVAIPQP